uniref:Acetyl-CoA carboxylase n=1 Tax=Aureoumbra lagunensis TaxID=44058 RepID=A0A7S3K3Q2_9STRA|mmetsp:Transcript_16075/g.24116  ORF Transcript_16075/g.24116 Transcript_16075/m.24116 type:complete len:2263 (+) Transcript_16075:36-6824(+)
MAWIVVYALVLELFGVEGFQWGQQISQVGGLVNSPLIKPGNSEFIQSKRNSVKVFSALEEKVDETSAIALGDDAMGRYVYAKGGKRAIRKVLIANNGMAATKSIMSMRRWAYETLGSEKAIRFVVMATPDDLNANAEFIRLADEYVDVPGGSNVNNYANVKLIVDTAQRVNADAVWPGWGHASENPKLPRALTQAGVVFMGPPAPVMSVLGDKIAANILAQTAKVPSIPWSGSFGDEDNNDGPLQAKLTDEGTIPEEIFDKACVHSIEEALAVAERVGYPVMLKASEGGGGKGIRMNQNADELKVNYPMVINEVPGSPVFIMQLVTGARHLEVQVIGDEHGNAIALNGRDCSTQRRFQKIFEEGPPTKPTGGIAVKSIFDDMQTRAKDIVRSIGYVGAGTVEYLYDSKNDEYSFLELNPRLQVEHPVTEGLTDVNIPATQLQVAMGIPLSNLPQIRRLYGCNDIDDWKNEPLDLTTATYELPPNRHVLAARITAENPDEAFKPTAGAVERISFQSTPSVWGYFSVGANGAVHEFADSQFGHLFAFGKNREEARKSLVLALKELKVRGDIRNPIEYLVQLLETEDFKANNIDTAWLDGLLKEKAIQSATQIDDDTLAACAALFRSHERSKRAKRDFQEAIAQGQFSTSAASLFDDEFEIDIVIHDIRYNFAVSRTARDSFSMRLTSSDDELVIIEAKAREQPDGTLLATIGGVSRKVTGLEEPLGLRLVIDGATIFIPAAFDPSEVRSDVTGKLVRWLKEDGQSVSQGEPFAEVEAMKMIMPLRAAEAGAISYEVAQGAVIETGQLLAKLELEDASKARQIRPYDGNLQGLSSFAASVAALDDPMLQYERQIELLAIALDGYDCLENADSTVAAAIDALAQNGVMKLMLRRAAGAIGQKMPAALDAQITDLAEDADASVVTQLLEPYSSEVALDPLRAVVAQWSAGAIGIAVADLTQLLDRFLAIEEKFVGRANEDEAKRELVKSAPSPDVATETLFAHAKLPRRARVINALIKTVPQLQTKLGGTSDNEFSSALELQLERLAALETAGPEYAGVALAASIARLESSIPDFSVRVNSLRSDLKATIAKAKDEEARSAALQAFATRPELGSYQRGVDMLVYLFDDDEKSVARAAAEAYVRRMYSAHDMLHVDVGENSGVIEARWWYKYRSTAPKTNAPLRFGKLVLCDEQDLEKVGNTLSSSILPAYEQDVKDQKPAYIDMFGDMPVTDGTPLNTLHVLLKGARLEVDDETFSAALDKSLNPTKIVDAVSKAGVRSVNFIANEPPLYPRAFTFEATKDGLKEDPLRRNMRPTFYHLLELESLTDNYNLTPLPTVNRDLRIYIGDEKDAPNPRFASQRVFVRRLTHSTDLAGGGAERLFDKALDALESAQLDARVKETSSGSLYLTVIPPVIADDAKAIDAAFKKTVGDLIASRASRLLAARVDEIQVRLYIATDSSARDTIKTDYPDWADLDVFISPAPLPPQTSLQQVRCVASSAGGPWLALKTYIEEIDPIAAKTKGYCNLDGEDCVVDPEPSADKVSKKRAAARRVGTTYAYDFIGLLATATLASWQQRVAELEAAGAEIPEIPDVADLLVAKEILFDEEDDEFGVSTKNEREVGTNDVGMLAWDCIFKTPEYSQGRRVVLIANDVTYQSGSFGVKEDDFFAKVSNFAAVNKIPRVYLSSNSGARIGLVDALKSEIGVQWIDEKNPNAGFEYLYLTPEQLETLPQGCVEVNDVNDKGHHEITAIIGAGDQVSDGIGVENLRGSGTIAGVTSRAYRETFTLSYVTGRSVGIGAYLVRLGQRVIQMKKGPMILTGYQALNKLLGKSVYTSQDQLGGPQIMVPNGVTHKVVEDDFEGVRAILHWLSFVPDAPNKKSTYIQPALLPPHADPIDRPVTNKPPAVLSDYDVRQMLDDKIGGGFFDKGSFVESLAGWGKTVVTGRARLGGIPFGVIAVETRTVEAVIPADPANAASRESILPQAGGVWYPDSAAKTAQALEDFNNGEHLPVMIFANWRGFSGGTRDMYHEVLKFGARIVDALTVYSRPVFVYLPPNAELRGGAWVVIDPTINPNGMMEMYADPLSRGGILEPPGIVEVKFRDNERKNLARRLDPEIPGLDHDAADQRLHTIAPAYLQVATEFADLHDRAGRMKAKGVIREIVSWEDSRKYFYWRAKRRLAIDALVFSIIEAYSDSMSFAQALDIVQSFCAENELDWNDDKAIAEYIEANQDQASHLIARAKKRAILDEFKQLVDQADADIIAQAKAML